ncbi:ComEC family competence protein [Chloroflexales bacterium ZM16-3]|nr:ComEC family competence protein [Chloroflexales bacterium ZM16-3]
MLIRLAIAWMAGVVAGALWWPGAAWLWAAAGAGLLAALALRRSPRGLAIALSLACAALGALRYGASVPPAGPDDVRLLAGRGELTLAGTVAGDPTRSEEGQKLLLRVEAARLGAKNRPVEGLVLITLAPFPAYSYGDRLAVTGELLEPRPAAQPGDFDYKAYLAHRGIHVLMRDPAEIRPLAEAGGGPLRLLYDARERCRATLVRLIPEPQAALIVGILLGIQSSIPDDVYAAFSTTGTSHILVVSGWNFTIVAALLGGLMERLRLGRWPAFWITLAMMWVYAMFTGGSAAVLRAAVMASLMVLARASERRSEPWTLLLAACWIISAADPHTLWDLGFQLSAMATGSLFAFARPVEGWLGGRPPFSWPWMAPFTEALTATLAAQVLTLPLILYAFGNLSIIAPLANVLIVPVVPYAMLFGSLALAGGLLWLPLGQALGTLLWLPLTWIAQGVSILSQPTWAAVQMPPFPLWLLLGYYVVIGAGWWWSLRSRVPEQTSPALSMPLSPTAPSS